MNVYQSEMFLYIGLTQAQHNVPVEDVAIALRLCGHRSGVSGETLFVSERMRRVDSADVVVRRTHLLRFLLIKPTSTVYGLAEFFRWTQRFPLADSRTDVLTGYCAFNKGSIRQLFGYPPTASLQQGLRRFAGKFGAIK